MSYEQKDNSGSLFKNDKKESPNHPDYKGSCMVNGVECWMDAWIKPTKDGAGRWMSFSFKPKGKRTQQAPRQPARQAPQDFNDDIPF